MEENRFSGRLAGFTEDDGTFESESEHGGYMKYACQMSLADAGYLVPLDQFQESLDCYAQEIQKAVRYRAAQ